MEGICKPQPEAEPHRQRQQQSVDPDQQKAASPGRKANGAIGKTNGRGTRQLRVQVRVTTKRDDNVLIKTFCRPTSEGASHRNHAGFLTESRQRWLALEKRDQVSTLTAFLQEVHQHPTPMLLSSKEQGQDMDDSLFKPWTKAIRGRIPSQLAKGRKHFDMTFPDGGLGDHAISESKRS